jgi:hypothetical protein
MSLSGKPRVPIECYIPLKVLQEEVFAGRTLAGWDGVCEVGILRPDRFDHEGNELPSTTARQSGSPPGDWRGATPKGRVDGDMRDIFTSTTMRGQQKYENEGKTRPTLMANQKQAMTQRPVHVSLRSYMSKGSYALRTTNLEPQYYGLSVTPRTSSSPHSLRKSPWT